MPISVLMIPGSVLNIIIIQCCITLICYYSIYLQPLKITWSHVTHDPMYRKGQDSCHVLSCMHIMPILCKNGEDQFVLFLNCHAIYRLQWKGPFRLEILTMKYLSMSEITDCFITYKYFWIRSTMFTTYSL